MRKEMRNQIKKMRKMSTSQAILNCVEYYQSIKTAEHWKQLLGLEDDCELYGQLETIGYKIAVRKAKTHEELEQCAVSLEENYTGPFDPFEWAEQIRVKIYGIEWYLSECCGYESYEDFVNTINKTTLEMGVAYAN
jgi:hypothetical protein